MQNNIPPYSSYPAYGYSFQPPYNPAYMNPYSNPALLYDGNHQYQNYPIHDYSQTLGVPTSIPAPTSQHPVAYNPYAGYEQFIPAQGPYVHPTTTDPAYYYDHHANHIPHNNHAHHLGHIHDHYHHLHNHHTNSSRGHEKSTTDSLSSTKEKVSILVLFQS